MSPRIDIDWCFFQYIKIKYPKCRRTHDDNQVQLLLSFLPTSARSRYTTTIHYWWITTKRHARPRVITHVTYAIYLYTCIKLKRAEDHRKPRTFHIPNHRPTTIRTRLNKPRQQHVHQERIHIISSTHKRTHTITHTFLRLRSTPILTKPSMPINVHFDISIYIYIFVTLSFCTHMQSH